MPSIYLLNYPSFYKHLIPSHRQARAPVILLYFEELREVATRLGKVSAYYITADKIERMRKTGGEREKKERERVETALLCWLLDWAGVGHKEEQQSSKCGWQLTGLAFGVGACLCLLFLYARSDAVIENLSVRALGGVQEEARCSHVSNLPGFSPSASFLRWQVRYAIASTAELNPKHNNNNFRSYTTLQQDPLWLVPANAPSLTQKANKILEFSSLWKKKKSPTISHFLVCGCEHR